MNSQRSRIREMLDGLDGGLVVSCQARPGNPLHGASPMAMMAQASELGGARGLRIDGPANVAAVVAITTIPVIATCKVEHPDSRVIVTPTTKSAEDILAAGAKIVALDATHRRRPNDEHLRDIVDTIHAAGAVAMGDLAHIDDLPHALASDIDAIGTTLSGYAGDGPVPDEPDFDLLARLIRDSPVPVFAAGRYWTPDQVTRAFELGALCVVVGTAITNPMAITSRFVNAIARMSPASVNRPSTSSKATGRLPRC
ncbi:MAG: N-acetylmannosamine-6-phosphate 2-epimerase [Chloroflexota bacterium]|nr:N-acetylmannosamine-6-phosphate 2-epimerase [Chloroflexota bacterium]